MLRYGAIAVVLGEIFGNSFSKVVGQQITPIHKIALAMVRDQVAIRQKDEVG